MRRTLTLLSLLLLPFAAEAQVQLPEPVGYINDFADVIPPELEARIQRVIDEVRAKSGGGEIVVVTLPSLEGRPIEEVGLQIGREWRIGPAGEAGDRFRNTGAVVLVAPTERRLRLELGTTTNTFITAAEAGRIRDGYMLPSFREGDFGTGIYQGVAGLALEYAENFGFELPYSKLQVNVSDLFWQSSWPVDHRTWIPPLLYTPPTFAAYKQNRDLALEAIISLTEHLPGV